MPSDFGPARDISLFSDDDECLDFLNILRAESGCPCPRCQSKDVLVKPQARKSAPAFLCQNCNYRFSATAGTPFMGTMLSISKCVQMLTLYDALGNSLPVRDARHVIGVAGATVGRIIGQFKQVGPITSFTKVEAEEPTRIRLRHDASAEEGPERFFVYCDRRSILVSEEGLTAALRAVISTPLPGMIEAYKRRSDARIKVPRATVEVVVGRKDLARQWIDKLRAALPGASMTVVTRMAWHLVALGVDSDQKLAELTADALRTPGGNSQAMSQMRDAYVSQLGVYGASETRNRMPME